MSTITTESPDQKLTEAVSNTITGIKESPDAAQATFEAESKLEDISVKNCPVLDIIENKTPVEGSVQFFN